MPDDPYPLADLARLADVTPRTIRYYVTQGLLPSPAAAGPATRYTEGHLVRLRLIKRLQRDHLPLNEIRGRLEQLGDEEVRAALEAIGRVEPEPEIGADATLAFVRDLMARTSITPHFHDPATGPALPTGPAQPAAPRVSPPSPMAPPPSHARALRLRSESPDFDTPTFLRTRLAASAPAMPAPTRAGPTTPAPTGPAPSGAAPAAPSTPATTSAPAPGRSTWERIPLTSDVEVHVRRPLDRTTNKRLDKLLEIARDLFRDGP